MMLERRARSTAARCRGWTSPVVRAGAAAVLALTLSGTAQAFSSLGLTGGTPDIISSFLDVTYTRTNVDGGTLTAESAFSGLTAVLDPPGSPAGDITNATFDLFADVNFNAQTATGNLTLGGDFGGFSGDLLTGSLNSTASAPTFGTPGGETLEFIFNVTGGELADLFGDTAGVILSNSGYTGSFDNTGFMGGTLVNDFTTQADTFGIVPAPGTLVLLAGGLLLYGRRRGRAPALGQCHA